MNPVPVSSSEAVWERQTQAGASWFLWIAGLSALNLVTALAGSGFGFVLSLALPMGLGGYAHDHRGDALALGIAIILGGLTIGLFVLFGLLGRRGARWALITGLVLYGMDTVFWVVSHEWFGAVVHAYALWRIGQALAPAGRLAAARRQAALQAFYGAHSAAAAPVAADPTWYSQPGSAPANPDVWPPPPQGDSTPTCPPPPAAGG